MVYFGVFWCGTKCGTRGTICPIKWTACIVPVKHLYRIQIPVDLVSYGDDIFFIHVSIYICRDGNICMSHELLSRPDIHTCPGKICTVCMPQIIRHKIIGKRQGRYKLVAVHPARVGADTLTERTSILYRY